MNCPACGADNREGARFCRGCGAALVEPPPGEEEPAAEAPEAPEAPVAKVEPDEEPEPEEPAAEAETPEISPEESAAEPETPEASAEEPTFEPEAVEETPEPETEGDESVEPEPEGPVTSMPEDKDIEPAPEPEDDVLAFWRDEVEPLEPAEPGTVVAGRYELVEVLDVQDDEILYLAHDLDACWQCGFEGNAPDDDFCAQCGAALDQEPEVHVLEVQHAEAEPSDEQAVAGRLEHDGRAFVVLAEAKAEPEAEAEAPPLPPSIRLLVGQRSAPGQVRELNEDSVLTWTLGTTYESETRPVLGLFAVADGMGGHEGGEIASKMALQALAEQTMVAILAAEVAGELMLDEDIVVYLRQAVMAANDAVYLARQKAQNDMGTTLTAAFVRDDRLFLAHVGDCRAYRWNADGLEQLTADHSVVASMVASRQAAPDEIYTHPHRSVIYRSIGDKPLVEVDTDVLPLAPGDRLVVCSDGLWEMIRSEGIEDVLLQEADPQAACDLLIKRANAAGGDDNISAIVVQVEAL